MMLHPDSSREFRGAVVECLWGYAVVCVGIFIFYLPEIPERLAPGAFDLVGSSHQLWHLALIVAVQLHTSGVTRLLEHLLVPTAGLECSEHGLPTSDVE